MTLLKMGLSKVKGVAKNEKINVSEGSKPFMEWSIRERVGTTLRKTISYDVCFSFQCRSQPRSFRITTVAKMVNKRVSEGADTGSEFDFKLLSVGVKRSIGVFRLDLPLTRACSKKCWKIGFSKHLRFRLLHTDFITSEHTVSRKIQSTDALLWSLLLTLWRRGYPSPLAPGLP